MTRPKDGSMIHPRPEWLEKRVLERERELAESAAKSTLTTNQLIAGLRGVGIISYLDWEDNELIAAAALRLEQLQIDADNNGTAHQAVRAELQAVKELPPRRIIFR